MNAIRYKEILCMVCLTTAALTVCYPSAQSREARGSGSLQVPRICAVVEQMPKLAPYPQQTLDHIQAVLSARTSELQISTLGQNGYQVNIATDNEEAVLQYLYEQIPDFDRYSVHFSPFVQLTLTQSA